MRGDRPGLFSSHRRLRNTRSILVLTVHSANAGRKPRLTVLLPETAWDPRRSYTKKKLWMYARSERAGQEGPDCALDLSTASYRVSDGQTSILWGRGSAKLTYPFASADLALGSGGETAPRFPERETGKGVLGHGQQIHLSHKGNYGEARDKSEPRVRPVGSWCK